MSVPHYQKIKTNFNWHCSPPLINDEKDKFLYLNNGYTIS